MVSLAWFAQWKLAERVKVAMGVRKNSSREKHWLFAYHFQVADVAMQMDVHKALSCFYTTNKTPQESTLSSRIYFEIFFKWSCSLYEFARKVYFLWSVTTFAELSHKCRYHCKLHTNESEMDMNYQQLRFRLPH